MANGTSALHIALLLSNVNESSEVITQPLTFVATCNAIKYCGANPIFIDVDKDTMGLSPSSLKYFFENNTTVKNNQCINNKTSKVIKACMPMHTFGFPVHLDELLKICNLWKIPLVEDAAESLGSFVNNKHTGTFGKVSTLSFNGNKDLLTSNIDKIALTLLGLFDISLSIIISTSSKCLLQNHCPVLEDNFIPALLHLTMFPFFLTFFPHLIGRFGSE